MLHVTCSGTPHEIGIQHGQQAKQAILRTIAFYAGMFQQTASMDWDQVRKLASQFEPIIKEKWPKYLEEMEGIAHGADVSASDIIAINVRTEIAFGLFSDGCTAMSWRTANASFLAQNWDWDVAQQENLVVLTIQTQPESNDSDGKNMPTIKMITEAGLIGKIGLNSAGVGVCLNAIRARGMDPQRLPCHLALRMVLESSSLSDAVTRLEQFGVASACHMLVADATGSVGLEWSSKDLKKLDMNASKQIFHSNHWLVEHEGVVDTNWLDCSGFRLHRIEELCREMATSREEVDSARVARAFQDEQRYPASICRDVRPEVSSEIATLFNIVMDLEARSAKICLGRPIKPVEEFEICFP